MKKLLKQIRDARMVFVCGNGGSAATAEHLSNDLFSKDIAAMCLNSNVSIITMIANDYGYEHIFSMQLQRYAKKEDLLITISCSGTSPNISAAIEQAKIIGMKTHQFQTFGVSRDYSALENEHMEMVHKIKDGL